MNNLSLRITALVVAFAFQGAQAGEKLFKDKERPHPSSDAALEAYKGSTPPPGIGAMLDEEVAYGQKNGKKLREKAVECLDATCSNRPSPQVVSRLNPSDRRPAFDSFVPDEGKELPFDPSGVKVNGAENTKMAKVYWVQGADGKYTPTATKPTGQPYHVMNWRFGNQTEVPKDGLIRAGVGKLYNVESYVSENGQERRVESTVEDLMRVFREYGHPRVSAPLDNTKHTGRYLGIEPGPNEDEYYVGTDRYRQWKGENGDTERDSVYSYPDHNIVRANR